jgi:2-oxoisovalerate dehydrogenase E1 component
MLRSAKKTSTSSKRALNVTTSAKKPLTTSTKLTKRKTLTKQTRKASTLPEFEPYSGAEPTIMPGLRQKHAKQIDVLQETIQARKYDSWLGSQAEANISITDTAIDEMEAAGLNGSDAIDVLRAGMMTFLTHVESRASSATNQGFYTIGPCGEELLGMMGLHFKEQDGVALHYRHLAVQFVRQLRAGRDVDEILLDRARGHTVSTKDPVTGGVHCALGGGQYDFLVTSTLASQSTPAVGRALSGKIVEWIKQSNPNIPVMFPHGAVNFVSLGDGSINNGHFLSAVNFAEYAKFRKFSCPVVFCISDNDISISLRGFGYLQKKFLNKLQMPVFKANGSDPLSLFKTTEEAIETARKNQEPVCLYVGNLSRRFGHAATDRQNAYLSATEIQQRADFNPLESLSTLLHTSGTLSFKEQQTMFNDLWKRTQAAFNMAVEEGKITSRSSLMDRVSIPLATLPQGYTAIEGSMLSDADKADGMQGKPTKSHHQHTDIQDKHQNNALSRIVPNRSKFNNIQTRVKNALHTPLALNENATPKGKDVMRKHMTKVFHELMQQYPQMIYMGEDVTHGGYYLVTEGLAHAFPGRVRDFPPDETPLVGAGMGFAQAGLVPIVEIPYIKYLDCAMDQFTEAGVMSFLSDRKQPNGMIFRLQGFGFGLFGGNYHTHNVIYTMPGFDVVCWSNGQDYARGMRYAVHQAQHGRVVATVDSTTLLNLRHVDGEDDAWRKTFTAPNEMLDFEQVIVYPSREQSKKMAIVTYGEGVPLSLKTVKNLNKSNDNIQIDVIDTPLLNRVPQGLKDIVAEYESVLFVDPCKDSMAPLANHAVLLQRAQLLPQKWSSAGAQPTYNPLGNGVTFVSADDVTTEIFKLQPDWKF